LKIDNSKNRINQQFKIANETLTMDGRFLLMSNEQLKIDNAKKRFDEQSKVANATLATNNFQLSTVNYQPLNINCQTTINYQLSIVNCLKEIYV
jgi:hypothetical protein